MLSKYLKMLDLGERTVWIECELIDLSPGDIVIDKEGGCYRFSQGPNSWEGRIDMIWNPIKLTPRKKVKIRIE